MIGDTIYWGIYYSRKLSLTMATLSFGTCSMFMTEVSKENKLWWKSLGVRVEE